MSVKIRLERQGKKKKPYYHIVVSDARSPRDGRFIERIGNYNPNINPAMIEIDEDKALEWLQKGAQPTETARAILSYKGILLKRHLAKGVAKGAFTEAEAEKKHKAWVANQEKKIENKRDKLSKEDEERKKKQLSSEFEVKEAKAKIILEKQSALAAEVEKASKEAATEVVPVEETPKAEEEAPAEVMKSEETPKAEEEAPAEEAKSEETPKAKEETPAEEAKSEETPPAEEEAPAEEVKSEETPAAEEEVPAEEVKTEGTSSAEEEAPAEEAKSEETPDNPESVGKDESKA